MPTRSYDCGTLTIANAGTISGTLAANPHYQNASALIISSENAAHTGTINVEVSTDGTNFRVLQSAGSDVVIGVSDAVVIQNTGFTILRLVSGSAEGAARTFTVRASEDTGRYTGRKVR